MASARVSLRRNEHLRRSLVVIATAAALALSLVGPRAGMAAASLSVTPISWDVIGLDHNNPLTGPETFPVAARACNTGTSTATNVTATFVWDTANSRINLATGSPSSLTVASLAASACTDFYFNARVTRQAAAFDTARGYHITVSADGVAGVSTPAGRQLYVERLRSQNRNTVASITGPGGAPATTTVTVGQTYTYVLTSETAPGGYDQFETFLDFPNLIFQIVSVSATYTTPTGYATDKVYTDACGWEPDPADPDYNSCVGPDAVTGGSAGDVVVTTYQVRILTTGTATVAALIYDMSGASYHYNTDFGVDVLSLTAVDPSPTPTPTPTPTPDAEPDADTDSYPDAHAHADADAHADAYTEPDADADA